MSNENYDSWVGVEYIQASPHRIATLASCDMPVTVKAMRSFVGAYKMLARVVPGCSALLAPFDSNGWASVE